MNKLKLLYAGAGLIVVAVISAGAFLKGSGSNTDVANEVASVASAISIPVETIGTSNVEENEQVGTSWPGEIISSGDIEVQPQREGTIVEWKVKIGENVRQGQILARLSAPPATPELTRTLAEQAQSLARAKAQASATADFTRKNIEQLTALRSALEKNLASVDSVLELNGSVGGQNITLKSSQDALNQLRNVVDVKKQNLRKTMEQILNKHIQKFSGVFDAQYFSYGFLKYGLGERDGAAKSDYEMRVFDLLDALKDPNALPIEAAQNYTQAAVRLVAGSIATEGIIQADLDDYRAMANEDQVNLLETIQEYQETKSDLAALEVEYKTKETDYKLDQLGQEKDYAEKKKEIDQKIAELEKELALAQAEVKGAEAAYATISNALTGGLNITAPRAGIVSIITKKAGDFVAPGTAVASINSGNENDRIVRFRIPGNVTPPQAGDVLIVIRPGFPKDGKKIKLAGIGVSLDGNGSFLADADFIDPGDIDWPVHSSVRVLPSGDQGSQLLTSISAVWWDDDDHPTVWLVTEDSRIRPQEVKTGRTLGDKIEILEGLSQGNRIVSNATSDLKTGMQLNQLSPATEKTEEQPEGDGHGHSHDE
ncbi:biotin/lipoyl-binding protein [bacterium]|nr:biotin/lipoyl-binding protein [bacterium]